MNNLASDRGLGRILPLSSGHTARKDENWTTPGLPIFGLFIPYFMSLKIEQAELVLIWSLQEKPYDCVIFL